MAHIAHRLGEFTGHIGPVRFVKGHAETEDPDLVEHFKGDPDTFDVTEDADALEDPGQGSGEDPTDDPED